MPGQDEFAELRQAAEDYFAAEAELIAARTHQELVHSIGKVIDEQAAFVTEVINAGHSGAPPHQIETICDEARQNDARDRGVDRDGGC